MKLIMTIVNKTSCFYADCMCVKRESWQKEKEKENNKLILNPAKEELHCFFICSNMFVMYSCLFLISNNIFLKRAMFSIFVPLSSFLFFVYILSFRYDKIIILFGLITLWHYLYYPYLHQFIKLSWCGLMFFICSNFLSAFIYLHQYYTKDRLILSMFVLHAQTLFCDLRVVVLVYFFIVVGNLVRCSCLFIAKYL